MPKKRTIKRGRPLIMAENYLEAVKAQPEARPAYDVEEIRLRRFHKAMSLKDTLGLTDDERYELAQMIPGVDKDDGGSWKELNPKQLGVLLNYMEGYLFISELFSQRT